MTDRHEARLSWAIGRLCHLHHNRIHALMDDLGLYRGQGRTLDLLWREDGRTHSDLSQSLGVQPATVSKMIQRMERAGFLERRADPDDQRVSRVFLTESGRQIKQQVDARFDQLEREAIDGLLPQEVLLLRRLLMRVSDNLRRQQKAILDKKDNCLLQPHSKERP